ncbi:hypothetical protein [Marvinbryantia formatexigens]|uniref:hypothetical protein n=1 Tax=Marvinbryantia formatexigens TaxID=168384 RepID=UPI0002FD00E4|nr:hypothetical protein [Marvinbryantia formatexigens]UWO23568.1 hypothetical protein NQ534_14050 [Marvinbryantia formatexigens DSM 14469]SDG84601.1 hypothetical protein SAMN05660368_03397 [Marvinbryantia formatexigens]
MNRIICISREYGSGGHEAAKRIAGHLASSIFITAPAEFRAGRKQRAFPGMESKKMEAKIRMADLIAESFGKMKEGL